MTKYIVEIDHPGVRGTLTKHGKVGKPQTLNTIIVFETDLSIDDVEKIPGVVQVEAETMDVPSDV